jgi:hypothetical protein
MATKLWNKLFKMKSRIMDPVTVAESVQLADPVIFDVRSDKRQATRTLKDGVQPVFSIPCSYNAERGVYQPGVTPPLGAVTVPGGVTVNNLVNPMPVVTSAMRFKTATASGYCFGSGTRDVLNNGTLDVLAVCLWLDPGSSDPKASGNLASGPPLNIVWGGVTVQHPYLFTFNVADKLQLTADAPVGSVGIYWHVFTAADIA